MLNTQELIEAQEAGTQRRQTVNDDLTYEQALAIAGPRTMPDVINTSSPEGLREWRARHLIAAAVRLDRGKREGWSKRRLGEVRAEVALWRDAVAESDNALRRD